MGLSGRSTGMSVLSCEQLPVRAASNMKVISLGGNPNVGKSTLFNSLTGLKQHTGNWPGKTVAIAQGIYRHRDTDYMLVDIPGTYSLMANSEEEKIARDFICFGNPDAAVIVTDATCLERNLNLVLQTIEITPKVVVCVNLLDEAKKKRIDIDLNTLSGQLGVPVVGTSARTGAGLEELVDAVHDIACGITISSPVRIIYEDVIEEAVSIVESIVNDIIKDKLNSRWVALMLIEGDEELISSLKTYTDCDLTAYEDLADKLIEVKERLNKAGIDQDSLRDRVVSQIVKTAEITAAKAITYNNKKYNSTDRRLDRILTSKSFGIPIMICLLGIIFWITITGANYPSSKISDLLFWIEDKLTAFCSGANAPSWVHGLFVMGIYRTVAWVVSVMLPPMAIFFPLFTLLEDFGYLPRVAFNLDKYFKKVCAHGKQALTMCMGFGCNAAGIIGCRIIDSPREKLIAMITNNFVPCNGRFPTLIAIITMFFAGVIPGPFQSAVSTIILTGVIVLGVAMTMLISGLLSKTILKGLPSSFILELPPYRRPQIGRVIVRSVLDRTLFVLARAVVAAAPAGAIIWIMANINIGGLSLLTHCASFLNPFARLMGLDGYILMAFILGFPANEIVVPIIIMSYMAEGSILEMGSLTELKELLVMHGWTWVTAVCTMLFSLMHWPCGTTCLTIRKESGSLKWTAVSILVPTAAGMILCFIFANAARLFGAL